jgi:hypothetical protein
MDAYAIIAKKLEELIKEKIKSLGLYDSGTMYNSIDVKPNGKKGFKVNAVDYFEFQNEEHKIVKSVVNSTEFLNFMANTIAKSIDDKIKKTN